MTTKVSLSSDNKFLSRKSQTGSLMVMLKMISKSKVNSVMLKIPLSWTMDSVLPQETGLITHGKPTTIRDLSMISSNLMPPTRQDQRKNPTGSPTPMLKMTKNARVN